MADQPPLFVSVGHRITLLEAASVTLAACRDKRLPEPIRLALGGRGVRSIEYVPALSAYLIVAGLPGVGGPFELYRWSGMPTEAPVAMPGVDMDGLQPEAMIAWPGSPVRLQIFSDDGTRMIDGKMCKEQTPEKQRFRTIEVTL